MVGWLVVLCVLGVVEVEGAMCMYMEDSRKIDNTNEHGPSHSSALISSLVLRNIQCVRTSGEGFHLQRDVSLRSSLSNGCR